MHLHAYNPFPATFFTNFLKEVSLKQMQFWIVGVDQISLLAFSVLSFKFLVLVRRHQ